MLIIDIVWQYRRDFEARIQCEGCGHKQILKGGYDDDNYHINVLPNIKCDACGESRKSLGITQPATKTKYEPWEVV